MRSFLGFLLLLFFAVLASHFPQKVFSYTLIPDTTCSGIFTCNVRTYTNCKWPACAAEASLGTDCYSPTESSRNICTPDPGDYINCQCDEQITPTTSDCFTQGNDCRINDTFCNAGDTAAQDCVFSGGSGTVCGDGNCQSPETYANCPADCGDCPTGYTYCSDCINACRPDTQSCSDWINDECGGAISPVCNAPPGGCATAAQCALFGAGHQFGGEGGGWCTAPLGPCCNACVIEGWYTENGACGGGSCGPCERELIYRSQGSHNFCPAMGATCVPDPNCGTGSCSPACGQAAGSCGGACPADDAGAPSCPASVTPPDGGSLTVGSGNQAIISWSASDKADYYNYQFYPLGQDCTHPGATCASTNNPAELSVNVTVSSDYGSTYTFRIRPVNDTCDAYLGTQIGNWCDYQYTLSTAISGNFYVDTLWEASNSPGGDYCAKPAPQVAELLSPGATIQANIGGTVYNGTVNPTNYSISLPFGTVQDATVTLSPGSNSKGQAMYCSCAEDCVYYGITPPRDDLNFYLSAVSLNLGSWWQASAGLLYAGGLADPAIQSTIPPECSSAYPACIDSLALADLEGNADSVGIPVTAGGSIDVGDGGYTEGGGDVLAIGSNFESGVTENYDYFLKQLKIDTSSNDNSDFGSVEVDAQKPSNGQDSYFVSGNMRIQNPWSVGSGEALVILISGDLYIEDPSTVENLIDVAEGGFLTFIVQGNIVIRPEVGYADNSDIFANMTEGNIEGIYIANNIIIESQSPGSKDNHFVGQGSFIAWNNLQLERNYHDGGLGSQDNDDKPTESFVYRPDFVVNSPESIGANKLEWQEVN